MKLGNSSSDDCIKDSGFRVIIDKQTINFIKVE